jgi:GMP synthase-like glutamine amidotransferase
VSFLVGRWSNPEGGEIVEFTTDGAMIVRRGTELLTTQGYSVQDNGAGAGRLSLRTAGGINEVVLGYCVSSDILAMSYGGQTTIYTRFLG